MSATTVDTSDNTPVVTETNLEIVKVEGWSLAKVANDPEPRIQDLELGERLGYDRVRKAVDLVKRLEQDGEFAETSGIQWRPTKGRHEIRPGVWHEQTVERAYLTEEQALLVCMRSDAPNAKQIRREIIRVYLAYRKGLLPSSPKPETAILRFLHGSVEVPLTPSVLGQLLDRLGPPQAPQHHTVPTLPVQPLDPNRGISIEYESDQARTPTPATTTIPNAARQVGISSAKIYPILLERGVVEVDPESTPKRTVYRATPKFEAHFYRKVTTGQSGESSWTSSTLVVRDSSLAWFLEMLKTPQAA